MYLEYLAVLARLAWTVPNGQKLHVDPQYFWISPLISACLRLANDGPRWGGCNCTGQVHYEYSRRCKAHGMNSCTRLSNRKSRSAHARPRPRLQCASSPHLLRLLHPALTLPVAINIATWSTGQYDGDLTRHGPQHAQHPARLLMPYECSWPFLQLAPKVRTLRSNPPGPICRASPFVPSGSIVPSFRTPPDLRLLEACAHSYQHRNVA